MALRKLTGDEVLGLLLLAGRIEDEIDAEMGHAVRRVAQGDDSALAQVYDRLAACGRLDQAEQIKRLVEDNLISFPLGQTQGTPGAIAALKEARVSPATLLDRHARGDWGDLGRGDWDANDAAVADGSRVFSAYNLPTGVRVWVITEAVGDDGRRALTTLLLPDEY